MKTLQFSFSIAILFFLCVSMAPAQTAQQKDADFAIRNARIFNGSKTIPQADVWVENGMIKAVGEHLKVPSGVNVIDGTGKTVLPGLIDSHTHTWGPALKDAQVFGVTTELDMFTDYKYAAQIRKEQAEGKDLDMADLRSAGTLVTAPHGHGTEYGIPIPTITSPEEAQAFVDARIAEGSDYIKIIYDDGSAYGIHIPTISKETMAAVVAAAHKRGKMAVAHIGSLQGAKDAIAAGVDGLAHLFVDLPPDHEFLSLASQHHVFVVPTLSVLASISGVPSGKALANNPRLEPYLSPTAISNLDHMFSHPSGNLKNAEQAVKELEAQHTPILAGTDSPNPGTAHGVSMHGELQLLVDSGLTPTQALASATSVPAAAFHLNDRGEIAPGKRADLLLVEGNPTAQISDINNVIAVWKLGVKDDRDSYRAAIEKEQEAEKAQKQAAPPAGSESGLISDFEDGSPTAKFGAGWEVSTDQMIGGKSTAQINVVDGGAEGSRKALQITGELTAGTGVSWAGAMFFPGTPPMAPANLSGKKAISFWTKGDGRNYQLMLFAKSKGYIPAMKSFTARPEWKKITIPLSDFDTDGSDLEGLLFSGALPAGKFSFLIDDVRLEQ
jgi:imidazolonepropionase-like amidohydrolase